jgi:phage terminase large subunit GpA-like protein
MEKNLDRLKDVWRDSLTPPKLLNMWQWAEAHIVLPSRASPKPGRYSTKEFPYVREPIEKMTDRRTRFVVLKWGAQTSKTMTMMIPMMYWIANDAGNMLWLFPNEKGAKSHSKTRWKPIVDANPCLVEMKPLSRHDYTDLEQHFINGTLNFIGGGSATNLASRSAGKMAADEIDKLKKELKGEADPLTLLFERAKWFFDRKIMLGSTPTVPEGPINAWFLKGTQKYFHIHCPTCHVNFKPTWKDNIRWSTTKDAVEMPLNEILQSVHMLCPNAHQIFEKDKPQLLRNGQWVAYNEDAPGNIESYQFSEILAPSLVSTWAEMLQKFLQASDKLKRGDNSEMKNFVNSSLGECWVDDIGRERSIDEFNEKIDSRPRKLVPDNALGITCGVDTQDDSFYYAIWAFGEGNTSWLIDEGHVPTLAHIEDCVLNATFKNESGTIDYMVEYLFIDQAGHRTKEVIDFSRMYIGRVVPCNGRGQNFNGLFSWQAVDKVHGTNTPLIGGLRRIAWNTVQIKDYLSGKMNIGAREPGAINLHSEVESEFLVSLTSEYRDEKGNWIHIKNKPNHYLDCTALAFLAAIVNGIEYRSGNNQDEEDFDANDDNKHTNEDKRLW